MTVSVEPVSRLPEVVDTAIEAYVRWREACVDADQAYRRWSTAEKADRILPSCAYVAALDREEAAASVYADAMRRLSQEFADGPLAGLGASGEATRHERPGRSTQREE